MATRSTEERHALDLGELADALNGYLGGGRRFWRWWRVRRVVCWYLARFSPLPIDRIGRLLGWKSATIRGDVAAVDDFLAAEHPRLYATLEAWLQEVYLRRN